MNAIWYDLAGSNNHKCQKLFYFLLSSLKQSEATKWAFQIILKLRFFTSLEGIKVFALAKSFEQFYIERKLEKPIFNSLLHLADFVSILSLPTQSSNSGDMKKKSEAMSRFSAHHKNNVSRDWPSSDSRHQRNNFQLTMFKYISHFK